MAASFINNINGILDLNKGSNETYSTLCNEVVDHYKFYQFTLIPATIITLLFAATKTRKNLFMNVLRGRPGLVFAMDSMTRTSRISYACAFGSTAFLVYKIVLEQTLAVEFYGHRAVKTFVMIASMFIYGMVFFPLFSSLAVGSVFGYALGSLYIWMLTGVEIYKLSECELPQKFRVLLIMRGLPSILCMLFLCLSIPIRMLVAFRKKQYFYLADDPEEANTMHDIQDSYSGHHVKKLFKKPVIEQPPEDKLGRVRAVFLGLVHRFFYQRQRGFRYPSRLISAMLISVLVIYSILFEILSIFPTLIDMCKDIMKQITDEELGTQTEDEIPTLTMIREICNLFVNLIGAIKPCIFVAISLATFFALLNILHTLSSFRANLFALYKGDHSHIPPVAPDTNVKHCINSIKYAGFQVGYMIWSFMLQFLILSVFAIILAWVIIIIGTGYDDWIIWIVNLLWPVLVTFLFVAIAQFLLAKFCFLQNRGAYLALNNRRVYFNFTYFMFFYNIFLGLVSCLIRIFKAMLTGITFLGRLDNSTLPRRFEFLDPGFQAYVGYMHMEASHTHPVLIVFTRLMLLGLQTRREREAVREGAKSLKDASYIKSKPNDVRLQMDGLPGLTEVDLMKDEDQRRKRVAARFNWYVVYTLLHNPEIRVFRKGYIQSLRQARLLGVSIPVSDRLGDVNMEELQQNIADARDRLNNPQKKDKKDKDVKNGGPTKDVIIAMGEPASEVSTLIDEADKPRKGQSAPQNNPNAGKVDRDRAGIGSVSTEIMPTVDEDSLPSSGRNASSTGTTASLDNVDVRPPSDEHNASSEDHQGWVTFR